MKDPIITQQEISVHKKQGEVLKFNTQFCAAIAGVRGGKTFIGAMWAAGKFASCEGNGIITAPTYKMLNQSTMDTFFTMFPSYRQYHKKQEQVIEFPPNKHTGVIKKIFLRSMEDPNTLAGITADWIWGDEAGLYPVLGWHELRSRVSLTKGQILFTTTPYNMGWLYQDFFQPWQNGEDKDLTVITWRSVDNPFFPRDVYDKERVRLSPQEFKKRYEGEFSQMEGLVYNLQSWNLVDPSVMVGEYTIGGVDWGWHNPAAITVVKYAKGSFTVVDEWYETNKTTGEIITAMQQMQAKWGVNRWYADSASPEKVQDANTNTGMYVVGYSKQKDSISQGTSTLRQLMNENRLFVFRGLKNTISEFNSYAYPEERIDGKVNDEPLPKNNHIMDALRYAIMGYNPVIRPHIPKLEGSYTDYNVRSMIGNNGNNRRKPETDTRFR